MLKLQAHQSEELSRSFTWAAFASSGFLFVTYQVVTAGWLITIDDKIATVDRYKFPDWVYFVLRRIDDLGLRGLSAVAILLLSAYLWRRFNTIRPILLSVVALLALNGVVGVFKLFIGRTKPRLNMDILNFGGMSYPSGHISNAVLIWGLFAYLVYQYLWSEPKSAKYLITIVSSVTTAIMVVSLFRNTHWFSDLIGGVFLGGALLIGVIALDRVIPSRKDQA
jgi:membrane-associated phospholipid phosphatase